MKKPVYCILLITFLLIAFTTSLAVAAPANIAFVSIEKFIETQGQTIPIDVRSAKGRAKSNMGIQGAIWLDPYSEIALANFVSTADKMKSYTIFCSCTDDANSVLAAQSLLRDGFRNVTVLKGGWDAILSSSIPITPLQ